MKKENIKDLSKAGIRILEQAKNSSHTGLSVTNVNNKTSNSRLQFAISHKFFPNCKRSQGHVEMVLSMTLFVGFIIFIFVVMNPMFKQKESVSNKDYEKILENMSAQIGILSVIVDSGCYNLNAVQGYGNNFIEVKENDKKYNLYYGDFFDISRIGYINCSSTSPPPNPSLNNFELGLYSKEEMIVLRLITNLKTRYENNYGALKEELGVGDFSFSFRSLSNVLRNDLSVSKDKVPNNVNILAKDIPARVINETGGIEELILNIRTW